MSEVDAPYTRWAELPFETAVSMTEFVNEGDFKDYGRLLYCSVCGTNSARRARKDLWAIRHRRSNAPDGHTRTYDREHLPENEWATRRPARSSGGVCPSCGLALPLVGICDNCG